MKVVGNTRFTSISKARARLAALVQDPQATVLLRQNEPVAALVSIEDYNDFMALQRLVRHPALFDRLRASAKKSRETPISKLRNLQDIERRLGKDLGKARSSGAEGSRSGRQR